MFLHCRITGSNGGSTTGIASTNKYSLSVDLLYYEEERKDHRTSQHQVSNQIYMLTCSTVSLLLNRLNGINQISNPQYGGDDSTSWHQNPSLIPTYETIPDHQTAVSTTELKEHGYDVLHEAMPKTIHRDTREQRRSSGEKVSSSESSSRYTQKLTQTEESDQAHVETGKSGHDARYSRGQTETEKGIKQDRTNTDQEKLVAKLSKEEDSAGHSEDKCITESRRNSETESTTSEHNYFCLEESVKDNGDHQQENCDMEHKDHRRDSAPPKGATARDYEDFVPSK